MAGVTGEQLARVEHRERAEVERRSQRFRGDRPRVSLDGQSVVIIDDGIATGSTARAACAVARAQGARQVLLATPVAPPSAVEELVDAADEVVALEVPPQFFAIGQWYRDFSQTPDAEVADLLERAAER